LLANVEPIGGFWIQAFLQFGGFAVLSWLVWYLFTKWMPKRDEEHARMLEAQRTDFRAELNNERQITERLKETFENSLTQIVEHHNDQLNAMWTRFDRRDQAITSSLQDIKKQAG
jgi:IS1 family transposase